MKTLKIVATIVAKAEYNNNVLDSILKLIEASRNEEACIAYDLHRDISNNNKYVILEHWSSQQGIDLHNNTEHYKNFGPEVDGMLESVDITVIEEYTNN